MTLREFNPQWAWIVTQWLTQQNGKNGMRIGMNTQNLDPISFRHMCNQPANRIYFIFKEEVRPPIGMVVLSEIDFKSKTASIWYLLSNTNLYDINDASEAVRELVKLAFYDLGLKSISARCVSNDLLSKEILRINHFNFIGNRRQCHIENGEYQDILLFDILTQEFEEFSFEPSQTRFMGPYHERSSLQNLSH